ncbi:hypothetical protein G210_5046 [Candida maltosa Xu316]|uniref:Uncharacterized protein n=1 Tax=Candida maltosa (strain Xu316) TaxID=1245528 RepID=M3ITP7_CANMX|nr:hypothetical protein G210_5046 [Candida maltosa Xu316]
MNESTPWSPFFQRLLNIFHGINTHLTFLTSHSRSVIPSLELLQKLNNTITPLDLSIIKYILPPNDVFFDYVDENQVMLSFVEEVKVDDQGYHQTPIADKYEEHTRHSKQILIFIFQDAKIHGIGKMMKSSVKRFKPNNADYDRDQRRGFFLDDARFQLQPLTQQQLSNMIKSRNNRFDSLLKAFVDKYESQEIAEQKLIRKGTSRIPEEPDLEDMVQILQEKETTIQDTTADFTTDEIIDELKKSKYYNDQIASIQLLNDNRPPNFKQLSSTVISNVHPELRDALLETKGISIDDGLYSHQATALDTLLDPDNESHVIVSTSTASGKSLIYQIPVLNSILWDITREVSGKRPTTAFFIFPTKALAQDQMRHFQDFIKNLPSAKKRPIIVSTYDGDTPFEERVKISNQADIIFTNPDTIHASILPNNSFDNWKEFLHSLKFVVMDELHIYKGTFGINVGYVMSRLHRIKDKLYPDDKIRFISCSATIQNPVTHFQVVCSIPENDTILHVDEDGSPCCEKKLVVWNPPPLMNQRGQKEDTPDKFVPRVSMISESAKLLLNLLTINENLKIIVFCPIRVICEMMMKEVRHLLQDVFRKSDIEQSDIVAYRGGYSKSDRRIIERKMFDGQLRAIIATNALELGIDLSHLDVVITCGFPMSKSNLHQQFGRAGRRRNAKGSLAIFVGGTSPVDQYYLENPQELIGHNYEDLCVQGLRDVECGRMILEKHLQCAAYEEPLEVKDWKWFLSNNASDSFVDILNKNLILDDSDGRYKSGRTYRDKPHTNVSIRAVEETVFAVVDITNNRNVVLEEIELSRTTFTLYEGGIFLHQGQSYLIKEFNHKEKYAKVERVNVDWTTSQRDYTDVDPEEVECVKPIFPIDNQEPLDLPVFSGKIKITMKVFGFFKVNRRDEILEVVEVNNPPVIAHAKGFWLNVPDQVLDIIYEKNLSAAGGIHAAAHAIMNMLPIHINGGIENGRNIADLELSTECKSPAKEFSTRDSARKRPARLVFYDTKGGKAGTGLSFKCFESIDEILKATFTRVKNCSCTWGCPLCVVSSTCKEQMKVSSRPAALLSRYYSQVLS